MAHLTGYARAGDICITQKEAQSILNILLALLQNGVVNDEDILALGPTTVAIRRILSIGE